MFLVLGLGFYVLGHSFIRFREEGESLNVEGMGKEKNRCIKGLLIEKNKSFKELELKW